MPVINVRHRDGGLAYVGYADRAAARLGYDLDAMLDVLLKDGWIVSPDYIITFKS